MNFYKEILQKKENGRIWKNFAESKLFINIAQNRKSICNSFVTFYIAKLFFVQIVEFFSGKWTYILRLIQRKNTLSVDKFVTGIV